MYLFYFYIFTLFSILISLSLTYMDIKKRSPFFLFWIVIIFLILVPSITDPFNRIVYPHDYASTLVISDQSLLIYSFYSFILMVSFLILYVFLNIFFPIKKVYYLSDVIREYDKKSLIFLVFLSTSIIGFYDLYSRFGLSLFYSFDFTTRREASSPILSFLLLYPFMICCGLGAYFFVHKKYFYLFICFSFYLFLYFVFGGSRQPLIAFALPFLCYYLLANRKINNKFLILSIVISFFAKILMDILIYLRNLPSLNDRINLIYNPAELFLNASLRSGSEENVRYAYYYYLQNSDYSNGYFSFDYLIRTLLFWYPSSIDFLNIKPEDFEYKMFRDYMNNYEGTMHPTIFGSIYADSGWLFFPWVIILSCVFHFLPKIINKFNGVSYFCLWSTCMFYSFMLARGSIYASIVVIMFAIFFTLFVSKLKFKYS